jgi:hypothetical protein
MTMTMTQCKQLGCPITLNRAYMLIMYHCKAT